VIIQCPKCQARYQYDPSRFEGRESKKIRCAKCQEVFEIRNPESAPDEVPVGAPAAAEARSPQPHEPGDMTLARHRRNYSYSGTPIDSPRVADLEAAAAAPEPELEALSIPSDRRFSLAITDGANAATVFRIEKARATIGRSEADIALDDAEASREHAALEIRGNTVLIEDLGSTNGTFVNGERIAAPTEIQNQQEFVVGTTTLMLIVTPED
jgi:predicted Zn finger-like uncharacterized protein